MTAHAAPDGHVGPAHLLDRRASGSQYVVVLCADGHVIASIHRDAWPGSLWEQRIGSKTPITCSGPHHGHAT